MNKKWVWSGVIASVLALGAGTATGYAISKGSDDTLPDNVQVAGLSIGGLPAQEAIDKINARAAQVEQNRVTIGDKAEQASATWQELGLTVDPSQAIHELEEYRDASWWTRGKIKDDLQSNYPVTFNWSDEMFAEKAEALWASHAEKAPKNASRTVTDQDEVVYKPEVPGTALDTAGLLAQVKEIAPTDLSDNGTGSSDEGTIQTLNTKLPVVKTLPEVTVDTLKEEGIDRKIAEFTTEFKTSGKGRSHNVTVAAQALNDTLLQPGDVFSYGDIVAKAGKEYGFQEAPVILKGKLTPGIGGGICQVSSTLYNAIIRVSNIDLVERRNHSVLVHYLPAGMDATFAEGAIDFRFRNSTGKQLLIKTVVQDKTLTVKLFGTMDKNVKYDMETVRQQEMAPKTVYVKDSTVAIGSSKVTQKGVAGFIIDTYRNKYVDGKLAERKKLNRSTYRAQDEIIAVNPADSRNGGSPTPSPQDNTPAEPV